MVFHILAAGLAPMFSIVGWRAGYWSLAPGNWLLAAGLPANPFSSVTTKHNFAYAELHVVMFCASISFVNPVV